MPSLNAISKNRILTKLPSNGRQADEIATSSVAYAEALASFHRKSREAVLDAEILDEISNNLRSDWQTFIRIQVTDELNTYIDRALTAHTLRGFDAIHLASAMILHEKFGESSYSSVSIGSWPKPPSRRV